MNESPGVHVETEKKPFDPLPAAFAAMNGMSQEDWAALKIKYPTMGDPLRHVPRPKFLDIVTETGDIKGYDGFRKMLERTMTHLKRVSPEQDSLIVVVEFYYKLVSSILGVINKYGTQPEQTAVTAEDFTPVESQLAALLPIELPEKQHHFVTNIVHLMGRVARRPTVFALRQVVDTLMLYSSDEFWWQIFETEKTEGLSGYFGNFGQRVLFDQYVPLTTEHVGSIVHTLSDTTREAYGENQLRIAEAFRALYPDEYESRFSDPSRWTEPQNHVQYLNAIHHAKVESDFGTYTDSEGKYHHATGPGVIRVVNATNQSFVDIPANLFEGLPNEIVGLLLMGDRLRALSILEAEIEAQAQIDRTRYRELQKVLPYLTVDWIPVHLAAKTKESPLLTFNLSLNQEFDAKGREENPDQWLHRSANAQGLFMFTLKRTPSDQGYLYGFDQHARHASIDGVANRDIAVRNRRAVTDMVRGDPALQKDTIVGSPLHRPDAEKLFWSKGHYEGIVKVHSTVNTVSPAVDRAIVAEALPENSVYARLLGYADMETHAQFDPYLFEILKRGQRTLNDRLEIDGAAIMTKLRERVDQMSLSEPQKAAVINEVSHMVVPEVSQLLFITLAANLMMDSSNSVCVNPYFKWQRLHVATLGTAFNKFFGTVRDHYKNMYEVINRRIGHSVTDTGSLWDEFVAEHRTEDDESSTPAIKQLQALVQNLLLSNTYLFEDIVAARLGISAVDSVAGFTGNRTKELMQNFAAKAAPSTTAVVVSRSQVSSLGRAPEGFVTFTSALSQLYNYAVGFEGDHLSLRSRASGDVFWQALQRTLSAKNSYALKPVEEYVLRSDQDKYPAEFRRHLSALLTVDKTAREKATAYFDASEDHRRMLANALDETQQTHSSFGPLGINRDFMNQLRANGRQVPEDMAQQISSFAVYLASIVALSPTFAKIEAHDQRLLPSASQFDRIIVEKALTELSAHDHMMDPRELPPDTAYKPPRDANAVAQDLFTKHWITLELEYAARRAEQNKKKSLT